MSTESRPNPTREVDGESRRHSIDGALVFRVKATLLQSSRFARDLVDTSSGRFDVGDSLADAPIIGESVASLWTSAIPQEQRLLVGKIHNLRLAARRLNGIEIPAGRVFSFWRQVGRASRWRGYVDGRELREGCLIPAIGGGLCQISGALYDAALHAGLEIVERHPHTEIIPGSLAEIGRDATVFWNYLDLRFTSSAPFRIEATMDALSLTVRIRGRAPATSTASLPKRFIIAATGPNGCDSCGTSDCFRHIDEAPAAARGSAYLVDDHWPEHDDYIRSTKEPNDALFVPIDGRKYRKSTYAWSTGSFARVEQSPVVTLHRAYRSRTLATQGAARQRSLLAFAEKLAASYAAKLRHDVTHVTVMQNLLPYLWRNGDLGGRTFDVLMTALPMHELQSRLDVAASLHPESPTLSDFRADPRLVAAEREALSHARRVVTPHSEIAALFGDRAELLDWSLPAPRSTPKKSPRPTLLFPASTLGRKGAYELREAIRGLDVQLVLMGGLLEGADFWNGFSIEKRSGGDTWLDGIDAVVLPSFVEHRPRRLLAAVAHGIPVIASTACGLERVPGVISVRAGDVEALRRQIAKSIVGVGQELQRHNEAVRQREEC